MFTDSGVGIDIWAPGRMAGIQDFCFLLPGSDLSVNENQLPSQPARISGIRRWSGAISGVHGIRDAADGRAAACRAAHGASSWYIVGNKFTTHTPLAEACRRLPRRPLECESRFCFPGKQQRLVTGPAPPAVKPMPPLPHSPAFRLRAPAPVLRCQHPVPPSEPPPKRFRPLPSQAPDRDPEKETKVNQNRQPFSVAVLLAVPSWAEKCTLCNHKTFSLTYLYIYMYSAVLYIYMYTYSLARHTYRGPGSSEMPACQSHQRSRFATRPSVTNGLIAWLCRRLRPGEPSHRKSRTPPQVYIYIYTSSAHYRYSAMYI